MAEDINLGLAKLDLSTLIAPQPGHQRKETKVGARKRKGLGGGLHTPREVQTYTTLICPVSVGDTGWDLGVFNLREPRD